MEEFSVEDYIRRLFEDYSPSQFVFAVVLGIFLVNASLLVHEKLGHGFVAYLLGYSSSLSSESLFEGSTTVIGEIPVRDAALIALGGPLVSFVVGWLSWGFGRRHPFRLFALILWLISTLPNLMPVGSKDASIAAQYFGTGFMWALFYIVFGVVWVRIMFDGVGPLDVSFGGEK